MTKRQLLVSTAQFYNLNNRAVKDKHGCVYLNEKNNRCCAIGRHLAPDTCIVYDNGEINGAVDTDIISIFAKNKLKKLAPQWMQNINVNLLRDIQQLHDTHSHWADTGISDIGKIYVAQICEAHNIKPLTKKEYERKQK